MPAEGSRPAICLVSASEDDEADILEWRNDPEAREMSLASAAIETDTHHRWYSSFLADPARSGYVAVSEGAKLGWVRFDETTSGTFRISILVSPRHRGGGIGKLLLSAALARAQTDLAPRSFLAEVKLCNTASRKLFEGLNFRQIKVEHGVACYLLASDNACDHVRE